MKQKSDFQNRKDDLTMENCYNYNLTGEKTLYNILNEFNRFRLALHDYYAKQTKSMAKYKGSFGYEKDYKKYLKEYKERLAQGQQGAYKDLDYVLSKYNKAVDNYIIESPSEEQLRILQTLSLKKKWTQEELDSIAQAVKDNPLALSVVTDKARENGLMYTRYDKLNNKPTKRQLQDDLEYIKNVSTRFIKTPFSRASEKVFEHRKRLGYINENDYDELKEWNEQSLQHELDFTDAYSFNKSLKVSSKSMNILYPQLIIEEAYTDTHKRKVTRSNNKDNMTPEMLDDILHEKGIEVTYNAIKHRIDINDTNKVLNGSEQPYNSLVAYLGVELRESYKYVSSNHIDGYLSLISKKHMKNPILEKIKNCKIDENSDYIKDIYENVLNLDKADKLSYTLVYKFFLQAVSMLMNKQDDAYGAEGVLVLQGAQGIGKSLFCQRMALSSEYFDTIQISQYIDRVDMLSKINGIFIGELAEVEQSLRPNNVATFKDIVTSCVDKYRPKYYRKEVNHVRRSSFIATCNTSYFLQDVIGNRRFWVIPCKKPFNIERLLRDNDIFLKAYKQAFNILQSEGLQAFRLTKSEALQLEKRNDNHRYTNAVLTPDILKYIYACDYFTISELKNQFKALKKVDASKIGKELSALGVTKKRTKYCNVYTMNKKIQKNIKK